MGFFYIKRPKKLKPSKSFKKTPQKLVYILNVSVVLATFLYG